MEKFKFPDGVHLTESSNLYLQLGEWNWVCKNTNVDRRFFEISNTFIVRLGGWIGGDRSGPSIFLNFKYVKKQDALILNIASKIVHGH